MGKVILSLDGGGIRGAGVRSRVTTLAFGQRSDTVAVTKLTEIW